MALKTYTQMNKTELMAEIRNKDLLKDVMKIAKDPNKPTNVELVSVLEKSNTIEDISIRNEKKSEPLKSNKATKNEERLTMIEDLDTLVPVIITDHDTELDIEDDSELRVTPFTWGNPVIGMKTYNIQRHGRIQYAPKGAIIAIKNAPKSVHTKGPNGRPVSHTNLKRFSVTTVEGFTAEQLEALKHKQKSKSLT